MDWMSRIREIKPISSALDMVLVFYNVVEASSRMFVSQTSGLGLVPMCMVSPVLIS